MLPKVPMTRISHAVLNNGSSHGKPSYSLDILIFYCFEDVQISWQGGVGASDCILCRQQLS